MRGRVLWVCLRSIVSVGVIVVAMVLGWSIVSIFRGSPAERTRFYVFLAFIGLCMLGGGASRGSIAPRGNFGGGGGAMRGGPRR